jgi:hypothetical protein
LKDVEQSDGLPSSLFGSLPSIPDHCSAHRISTLH